MSSQPSKGVAALLAAIPITGVFGGDKYYVGATSLGVIQTILTITIIGLLISAPWAWISILALVVAILFGGLPFLYPSVNWAPTTQTDKTIAWIIVGLFVLSMVVSIISTAFGGNKNKDDSYRFGCGKCGKTKRRCQCNA